MKFSDWLRGPLPKDDPFRPALNRVMFGVLLFIAAFNWAKATVNSSTAFVQYTLSTNPQTLTVPFVFQFTPDLLVYDTRTPTGPVALTQNSDYSVTGGSGSTGTVITIAGGAHGVLVGDVITIVRNVPLTQTTTFSNTGPLSASMIGNALDKAVEISQQLSVASGRSLQFGQDETLSGILPLTSRKGMILAFDANGAVSFLPSTVVPGVFVSQLTAGANITLTPTGGTGVVQITSSGGTAAPGGSNTQIQYNNAGALGGTSGMGWVAASGKLLNAQNSNTVIDAFVGANTNAGTATVVRSYLDTGRQFVSAMAGLSYSGTLVTGGPSGTSAAIYTTGSDPISIGIGSTEVARFTSTAFTAKGWTINATPLIQAPSGAQIQDNSGAWGIVSNGASTGVTITAQSGGVNTMKSASTTTAIFGAAGATILGTNTNDAAGAGIVGQYANTVNGSPVSMSSGVAVDVVSVSLAAGDYELTGRPYFLFGSTTAASAVSWWMSTTSATFPGLVESFASFNIPITAATGNAIAIPTSASRFSLATTTTVYLSAAATFTTSTMTVQGQIHWRRVR